MRELSSVKAEEMMKMNAIEQTLRKVRPETVRYVLDQVTAYELSIPRIEVEEDETNNRDMFRLMVECKFNFMTNSQVLWGAGRG